jgi:hypothetical protein
MYISANAPSETGIVTSGTMVARTEQEHEDHQRDQRDRFEDVRATA